MKKIFHFVKSNNLSGLENVVINICTMVKGYDYTYVSTKGPIGKYLRKNNIRHITIPKLTPWNIYKVIRKYKPNIVQAHDARASVFLAFSYFYCKKHHIEMISELHNDDPKMREWWRLRSILYCITSFTYNNIISVSHNIVNHYAYKKVIKNKISFIHNIINISKIKNNLFPYTPSKKWDCAFLGRMEYQKDPIKFVKIIYGLKKYKNHNIKAIMMGNGNLLKKVIMISKRYDLLNNISFTGFVFNPYKYLQKSKLLVMTSRFEGLPLSVLESILIGVPVVSTNLNILKNILTNCGCFEDNNKQFIYVIDELLNNYKKYHYIRKMQISKIREFNNVNQFIDDYRKVYE